MIDDTQDLDDCDAPSRVSLFSEIGNIMKYQVVRAHAELWSKNLYYLTYDDSNEYDGESGQSQQPNASSYATESVTGQCQRCERRTPVPSGHRCHSHFTPQEPSNTEENIREEALGEYANPCVHVKALTCDECQHVPLFPNEGPVTRFKIRQIPRGDSAFRCRHFVAVSYCWSDADSSAQDPYDVIDENGKHRKIRASRSTIDRVVNFARENGYRMIWIDQECIDQDNPEVKALAVQAIDLVYLEAHVSIALLRAQLQQKHLEALAFIFETHGRNSSQVGRRPSEFGGRRAFDLNTLVEAISLIADDKWNTRAWVLQEAFVSSGNMVLLFPQRTDSRTAGWDMICHEMSLSELAIRLDVIVECIQYSLRYIVPTLKRQISALENQERTQSPKKGRGQSSSELKMTLKRITLFHPQRPAEATDWRFGVYGSRQQRKCNAAVALTYLRLRDCFDKADKLAIAANMCGYPLRLNTVELGQRQQSLGTCIIALSLANGDFSLITPEIYKAMPKKNDSPSACHEFSWNRGFNSNIAHVHAKSLNTFGNTAAPGSGAQVGLSQSGLRMMGSMWKVDRFIECHNLQQKYREPWIDMTKSLEKTPPKTIWLATTHILFEIITNLKSRGEIQIADSILNSTSSAQFKAHGLGPQGFGRGVESVNEFPPGLGIENRQGLFSLDDDGNGRYHQCWIIDRVMDKGGFWVGKLVTALQRIQENEDGDGADLILKENSSAVLSDDQDSDDDGGHFMELLTNRMQAQLLSSTRHSIQNDDQRRNEEKNQVSPGDFRTAQSDILVALTIALNGLTGRSKFMTDGKERRGIFDLDGDISGSCLVFTPFNMDYEVIPRSELRNMSVSWQVQPVLDTPDDTKDTESNPAKKMRTLGTVKGMWRYTTTGYHDVVRLV